MSRDSPDNFDPENITGKYILISKRAVPCTSLMEWARWLELSFTNGDRRVGYDTIDGYQVSTVFLGLDHNFDRWDTGAGKRPILFESMVFAPEVVSEKYLESLSMQRYSTWDEAAAGHAQLVRELHEQSQQANASVEQVLARVRDSIKG